MLWLSMSPQMCHSLFPFHCYVMAQHVTSDVPLLVPLPLLCYGSACHLRCATPCSPSTAMLWLSMSSQMCHSLFPFHCYAMAQHVTSDVPLLVHLPLLCYGSACHLRCATPCSPSTAMLWLSMAPQMCHSLFPFHCYAMAQHGTSDVPLLVPLPLLCYGSACHLRCATPCSLSTAMLWLSMAPQMCHSLFPFHCYAMAQHVISDVPLLVHFPLLCYGSAWHLRCATPCSPSTAMLRLWSHLTSSALECQISLLLADVDPVYLLLILCHKHQCLNTSMSIVTRSIYYRTRMQKISLLVMTSQSVYWMSDDCRAIAYQWMVNKEWHIWASYCWRLTSGE